MHSTVLVSVTSLQSSQRFEKAIADLLPDSQDIYVSDAGMRLGSGYGQYREYVTLSADGEEYTLSSHSTDSEAYDYLNSYEYNTRYSNALKRMVLRVLEDNAHQIAA